MTRPSPVTPTIDFAREGVQHGHLRLPYSRDDSAWGSGMIPVAVVKRGDGPTALLTAPIMATNTKGRWRCSISPAA